MNIAYVLSRYPAVSHTFIMREVSALRARGVNVQTIAIRQSDRRLLFTEEDRREFSTTFAIRPTTPLRLIWAHITTLLLQPHRYLRAFWTALRCRGPGLRAVVWQILYFGEAGILASMLRRYGIRHVHAHFANVASVVARLASEMRGGTWSLTLHGLADFGDPVSVCLGDKIRSAAFIVCVSDFGRAQAMLHSDPELWPKTHVIRCGVDPKHFSPPSERSQDNSGGPVRLLNVARLEPEKGHTILLEAVQQISQQGIDVTCMVVGDGTRRTQLEQLARSLHIGDRVKFVGAVGQDEIHRYYDTADIFVMPSFAEGLPVVLMEAMAKQLPVVASQVMGIPELVENGQSGLLVPPGRAGPLADAVIRLAQDAGLRRQMGARGRARICRDFDIDRTTEALVQRFAEIERSRGAGERAVTACAAAATVGA